MVSRYGTQGLPNGLLAGIPVQRLMITRRSFLQTAGAVVAAGPATTRVTSPGARPAVPTSIKPPRLKVGDTVGLIDPASASFERAPIDIVVDTLAALGLKARPGAHLFDRYGYLAGTDRNRAEDINAFFADPSVNAILAVRGGWGCARILPLLDFRTIGRNPKILLGYSDLTALLLAIHAKTALVTFHGPVGISTWNAFKVDYLKRVLFAGEAVTFENLKEAGENLVPVENRITTITPGVARGRLAGGNLTVLSAIVGSGYLPDWEGRILFIEDVEEKLYRIDRMLTQLSLAGILSKVKGVVFGNCTRCEPGEGYGSLTLEEILNDHLKPLGVPAWSGAMIGHLDRQFTLGEGIEVEIDAGRGTIRMLEAAVV
jgi:muramoyltetrapeptide carboxypeptidase